MKLHAKNECWEGLIRGGSKCRSPQPTLLVTCVTYGTRHLCCTECLTRVVDEHVSGDCIGGVNLRRLTDDDVGVSSPHGRGDGSYRSPDSDVSPPWTKASGGI